MSYTDDPLQRTVPVKTVHITEIRNQIDYLFSSNSQPTPSWSEIKSLVKKEYIEELRSNADAAPNCNRNTAVNTDNSSVDNQDSVDTQNTSVNSDNSVNSQQSSVYNDDNRDNNWSADDGSYNGSQKNGYNIQ